MLDLFLLFAVSCFWYNKTAFASWNKWFDRKILPRITSAKSKKTQLIIKVTCFLWVHGVFTIIALQLHVYAVLSEQ